VTCGFPIELLFMRHGRTAWNDAGLTMGQTDVGLSSEGRREVHAIIPDLSEYEFDFIAYSPLRRCSETASAISKEFGTEYRSFPGFKERSWGMYEGLPKSERGREADLKGGETNRAFAERIAFALRTLPLSKRILLVSHSGVFRQMCDFGYRQLHKAPQLPHAFPIELKLQ